MASLRAMASGYIEAVLKLAAETPEAPHWDRSAYERISPPWSEDPPSRAAWVAVNGPDLLGFAVAQLVAGVCELEFIVVAGASRRKGIGRSLLETVIDWSLASGAQKLQLEVRAGNESAIAFYESAGFIREGLRHRYYRDPEEDAVLMGKRLYSDD
jgi:[ribosomal protein S18]-alanine N-acetyltransferase